MVRNAELNFSVEQFEAFQEQIADTRAQAHALAGVKELVERNWCFGGQEGDKVVAEYFLPFAPDRDVAITPNKDGLSSIDCDFKVGSYPRIGRPALYALHMDKPVGVITAHTEILGSDEEYLDCVRYLAGVVDLGVRRQCMRTLVMTGRSVDQAEPDGSGWFLENTFTELIRDETSQTVSAE